MMTLAIQGMVFGLFCAFLAKSKNRNMVGWFYLGFLFSIVALIALVGVPALAQTQNTQADQKKSYRIIIFWVGFTIIGTGFAFAWHNLYLPDSVYEILPAPAYKLRVLLDKFHASYQQLQSAYDQVGTSGQSSIVNQQIDLVEETIDAISSIEGLDDQTRIAHVASLSQIKFSLLELKRTFNQNYRY